MGLAEKRASKAYQDNLFPAQKEALNKAAGFDVPLQVEWDTIAVDGYAHLYDEAFTKVYFESLTLAFRAICQDEMGRDALKTALKSVVLCNRTNRYGADAFSFDNGVLLVDHNPTSNIDDVRERKEAIVTVVERAL